MASSDISSKIKSIGISDTCSYNELCASFLPVQFYFSTKLLKAYFSILSCQIQKAIPKHSISSVGLCCISNYPPQSTSFTSKTAFIKAASEIGI